MNNDQVDDYFITSEDLKEGITRCYNSYLEKRRYGILIMFFILLLSNALSYTAFVGIID